jgi:hypothetical protein
MKVCFLGNFRVPYTSENDYLWTMRRQLGIGVVTLQEGQARGEDVERIALGCDAFFWVHTHGWNTRGRPMATVLQTLRERGIPSFAYHLDLYMGLRRWRDYEGHDYLKVDHFFTVDKLMADWLNAKTQTKGHFVRAGVVERDCYLLGKPPMRRDVIFVGSYRYHPEWPYRPRLIDWLKQTYGDRFQHWGPQGRGLVRGRALNDLYASTKIVIGDTLCPQFRYPYYTSDRAYEVLGRGGFCIHPRIKGMDEGLKDREHLAFYTYTDWPGLKQTIDYYLENDEERERIRRSGHEHVKAHCTYTDRLSQIFKTLEVGP